MACEVPRSVSTSAVARHSNSVDQVAAVGDSSPNKCDDDDKNEQSDRGSPEISVQEKTGLDRLEKHCCINCDKVGKMLVCTEIGCPVAIHEGCLTANAKYDDSGNFYCLYCSYKRAVVRVQRSKKKAMSAKEDLSKFLRVATVDSFGGKEPENEKKEKAATAPPQSEDINQHADEIQPKQHVDQNMAAATEKCDLEAKENEGTHQVRNLEEAAVRKEHEKIGSSEKTKKAAEESTKGDAFEFNAGGNLQNENHESHNVSVSEGSEDGEQNTNPPKSNSNVKKNPSHKKKEQNVFPSQRKRKRLMWTDKEEEMLKDGVQIFSKRNVKNLPWRKILQLGSNVFHRTRVPSDLQNKWKNMTKKN